LLRNIVLTNTDCTKLDGLLSINECDVETS